MKKLIQKLLNTFNTKTINYLSIKEFNDLKVLERKNKISKRFSKYVYNLNKKQTKWLRNNY